MVSQNAIPSRQHLGGTNPIAFTEYGTLQLSNVLRSDRVTQMSIHIIEVFVKMRAMILSHNYILLKLEKIERSVMNHDEEIRILFTYMKQLLNPPQQARKRIGYKTRNDETE